MSDYWVSQTRHWCKYCKKYVANNKPSIQLHENGRSHKDEVERFLRGVYSKGRKDKEDAENVRRELARIEQAALSSIGTQSQYKIPSTSSSIDKPVRKATEYYVNPAVPTIEELRQQAEAEKNKVKVEGREEWALNKQIAKVGEWETVVTQPAATMDSSVGHNKETPKEKSAQQLQGAELLDDEDEDPEDLHNFKIKEKEIVLDNVEEEEDGISEEALTFKKRKADTTFKSRKKKPLRKKD